jgi:putative transcriptional regulator
MDVAINNRFGVLLAEKCKEEKRNISLQEVEEITGISRQSLYKWKNNSIERFEMRVLNALCKYFDVEPGKLFEYVADGSGLKPQKKQSKKPSPTK